MIVLQTFIMITKCKQIKNELMKWSKKWQLPFNATKCKVMHFGYHNKKVNYHLYDNILDTSHNEKDDNLKFHTHSATASKKANQILGIIKIL